MRKFTIWGIAFSFMVLLSGCNNGGGGSSTANPYPYQTSGSYNGIPYSELGDPPGLNNYPTAYFPTFVNNNSMVSSKIAYGRDNESNISNLTAFVRMGKNICSATPIYYNQLLNSTFLIGAAHCFISNKTDPNNIQSDNFLSNSVISVYNGLDKESGWYESFPATAIYVMRNYCYGATFNTLGGCPNFDSSDGVAGGQGNDLAVIQIAGQYANAESYPQIAPESQYPEQLTMAPVLSIGYGLNTQTPVNPDNDLPRGKMFYVANYFYAQTDTTGYHYLYNSFFNSTANGYAALICGGDSGGGDLFWTGQKWLLLSEHTYGPNGACGTYYNTLPNGATNVGFYYNWIVNIIQADNPVAWCNQIGSNCVTNADE